MDRSMEEASFFIPKISRPLITRVKLGHVDETDWVSSSLGMQLMDHSVGPLDAPRISLALTDFGLEQTALSKAPPGR